MKLYEGQKILLTLPTDYIVKANIRFILSQEPSIVVTYRDENRKLVYRPLDTIYVLENSKPFAPCED